MRLVMYGLQHVDSNTDKASVSAASPKLHKARFLFQLKATRTSSENILDYSNKFTYGKLLKSHYASVRVGTLYLKKIWLMFRRRADLLKMRNFSN